jgi:uncharacterized membrane protein
MVVLLLVVVLAVGIGIVLKQHVNKEIPTHVRG